MKVRGLAKHHLIISDVPYLRAWYVLHLVSRSYARHAFDNDNTRHRELLLGLAIVRERGGIK